jgi:hypothetical protein
MKLALVPMTALASLAAPPIPRAEVERVAIALLTAEEWSSFWSEDDARKLARAVLALYGKVEE